MKVLFKMDVWATVWLVLFEDFIYYGQLEKLDPMIIVPKTFFSFNI